MKKIYLAFLTVGGIFLSFQANAQKQRFALKVDALEAWRKNQGAAFEWRLDPKNSIEIQVGFRSHEELPAGVFVGEWKAHYAERRSFQVNASSGGAGNDILQYLGTGRPLPQAPPPIIQLTTMYVRATYGMSFQKKPQGLRTILLPGVSLFRHQHFEVKEKIDLTETTYNSWQIGSSTNQAQYVEQTTFYTQTREMRKQDNWIAGITYALGLAWQTKSGIYLEARLTMGVNIGKVSYSDSTLKPPAILNNYYGQGAFFAGWAF